MLNVYVSVTNIFAIDPFINIHMSYCLCRHKKSRLQKLPSSNVCFDLTAMITKSIHFLNILQLYGWCLDIAVWMPEIISLAETSKVLFESGI